MRSTVAQSVGVDISKDALDVAVHPAGESFRISNNPEGHRAFIKRVKGLRAWRSGGLCFLAFAQPVDTAKVRRDAGQHITESPRDLKPRVAVKKQLFTIGLSCAQ